jgi:hypothetical protein
MAYTNRCYVQFRRRQNVGEHRQFFSTDTRRSVSLAMGYRTHRRCDAAGGGLARSRVNHHRRKQYFRKQRYSPSGVGYLGRRSHLCHHGRCKSAKTLVASMALRRSMRSSVGPQPRGAFRSHAYTASSASPRGLRSIPARLRIVGSGGMAPWLQPRIADLQACPLGLAIGRGQDRPNQEHSR